MSLTVQLNSSPGSTWAQLAARTSRLISLVSRANVRYQVGSFGIDLPCSHALPIYRRAFPLYDTGIGRLARLVSNKYPKSSIVDIGANVGDTAAVIRSSTDAPLLCIEGNPAFTRLLELNVKKLGAGVSVEKKMVGQVSGKTPGEIVTERGTARIAATTKDDSEIDFSTLAEILARHVELPAPKLIKVDTDGFDIPILLGATDVLGATQPVLFFEFCPDYYTESQIEGLWEHLLSLGYAWAVSLSNIGEYEGSMALRNDQWRTDLRLRYLGHGIQRYADVALFSANDVDIGKAFGCSEAEATLHCRETRP